MYENRARSGQMQRVLDYARNKKDGTIKLDFFELRKHQRALGDIDHEEIAIVNLLASAEFKRYFSGGDKHGKPMPPLHYEAVIEGLAHAFAHDSQQQIQVIKSQLGTGTFIVPSYGREDLVMQSVQSALYREAG